MSMSTPKASERWRRPWLSAALLAVLAWPAALPAAESPERLPALENPGYQAKPDWFKNSFLDIREDLNEAAAANRRVLLYFYQDGCPYCDKLLRDNFGDRAISDTARAHFDAIALNLWGDREVVGLDGQPTTEKAFAAALGVQYTPTILLLDEQGQVVLRINGYYPPHQFHLGLRYVAEHREQAGETFVDYQRRQAPVAATGKLHAEGGFLGAPLRLHDNRRASERPLLVFFEQPVCAGCDELHQDILRRPGVAYALTAFDAAIVDAWSEAPLQTPDGRELPAREWAAELGIRYTPSLVFFDGDGNEVLRTEAWLRAFHVHAAMDYMATGAWRWQPSFQRFLQQRTDALHARGIPYDLME